MRVTKAMAASIAVSLTAKQEKEIELVTAEMSVLATDYLLLQTPKEVLDLFKSHRSWVTVAKHVNFDGNGLRWYSVDLTKEMPHKPNSSLIKPDGEFADKLVKLKNKHEKLIASLDKLRLEISVALINLRTFGKISEFFPEAVQYLPASSALLPAINLDSIRKQIK